MLKYRILKELIFSHVEEAAQALKPTLTLLHCKVDRTSMLARWSVAYLHIHIHIESYFCFALHHFVMELSDFYQHNSLLCLVLGRHGITDLSKSVFIQNNWLEGDEER